MQLNDIPLDQFVRAANLVEPSLIRVEADEVTITCTSSCASSSSSRWCADPSRSAICPPPGTSACARSSASSRPRRPRRASGRALVGRTLVGYFPTYTLGTLYSGQFLEAIERELGPIDVVIRAGKYDRLLGWMRQPVHNRGALVPPEQIARDATGDVLGHAAFMRYLRSKYGDLYDLGG